MSQSPFGKPACKIFDLSKDYNHTSLPHFYISLLSSRVSALEVAQLG